MSDRLERLDDYVTGALADADAEAFEEQMFAAVGVEETAEEELRFFDRAHRLMSWLAAHVRLSEGSTAEDVEALRAAGVRVFLVDITNEKVDVEPWPDDVQVVVFRCQVDIRGYEDVEVAVENPDGTPVKTFRGVLGDPATGHLYAICAPPLARMAYGTRPRISRLTGVRAGKREIIAVYETTPRP